MARGGERAFLERLGELETEIRYLNTSRNADLVARFEMAAAIKLLYVYVSRGDEAVLRTAEDRLRRMCVMVPLGMRPKVSGMVDEIIDAGKQLGPSDLAATRKVWSSHVKLPVETEAEGLSPVDVIVEKERVKGPSQALDPAGWVVEEAAFNDEIEQVRAIMRRLPIGLERWVWDTGKAGVPGLRWPIEKESQVQSLLWLALAPSVPGLKYEETLPSIGRTHPRVDLALPSVGLAIEVKFIRSDLDFGRVTQEIAADSSLYTSARSAKYSRLIVFVWDDTRSSERHQQLEEGLMNFRGVTDAIVISRPGRMC